MKPLRLPIFHHSDESAQLKDLGINYSLADCEIREMIFYHINAISPYIELRGGNENVYCSIHTNGTEYISEAPYEAVKGLIEPNF